MAIVFISSTYKDLKSYRKEVIDLLIKSKYLSKIEAKFMEDFAASPASAKKESLRLVSECDVFLGIYAYRYGYKPRGDKKSLIEQEYDRAVAEGKKIHCFVLDESYPWPNEKPDFIEKYASNTKLIEAFKKRIAKAHMVAKFTNEGSLVNAVVNALGIDQFSQLRRVYDEVSSDKKLKLIQQLVDEYEDGGYNEHALIDAVGRLSSKLKPRREASFPEIPEKVGSLLQGGLSPREYLQDATRVYPTPQRERLKQIVSLIDAYKKTTDKLPEKVVTDAVAYIASNYKNRETFPLSIETDSVVKSLREKDEVTYLTGAQKIYKIPFREKISGKKRFFLIYSVCLILAGAILMGAVYISNAFQLRTTFLPSSKNNPLHVNQWLLKNQVDDIVLDDTLAEGSQRALYALRFAHEINKQDESITEYLDELIDRHERINNLAGVNPQMLRSNSGLLNKQCKITGYKPLCDLTIEVLERANYMQDSLDYLALADSIRTFWANEFVNDSTLLRMNERVLSRYRKFDPFPEVTENRIKEFDLNINSFEKLLIDVKHDTLTYYDQLAMWEGFLSSSIRKSIYTRTAHERIKELNDKAGLMVVLYDSGAMVTAEDVQNLEAYNPKRRFQVGRVTLWARLKSDKAGRITVKWYTNGQEFYSKDYEIPATKTYRVYFRKNYKKEEAGKGEVRIYNNDKVLIGRRTFDIVS